jgi:hypothetical protein
MVINFSSPGNEKTWQNGQRIFPRLGKLVRNGLLDSDERKRRVQTEYCGASLESSYQPFQNAASWRFTCAAKGSDIDGI